MKRAPLADVCLAISSFRNDEAVLELLANAVGGRNPFHSVLIVDSLGTGVIPREIASRGYERVRYSTHNTNLGSAGNFAMRLALAAETDAKYVFALNHDGCVHPTMVTKLVEVARMNPQAGAVYPLRQCVKKGERFERTGEFDGLAFYRGGHERSSKRVSHTRWSSSNASLYNLDVIRMGLKPWDDLWMGWEDLGFGWLLHENGIEQLVVNDAVFRDNYEYIEKHIGPFTVYLSDKPTWYWYYLSRNLILINGRLRRRRLDLFVKIALEGATVLTLRNKKRERLRLLAKGVWDGVRGATGKGHVP